jgi:hypothetical protein
MTMPASPSNPNPAGDDRKLVEVNETTAVTFEDKLHVFWKKNRNAVLILCGLVLAGILAKGAWDHLSRQKEVDVEKAYAAATTPEQLKAFAASHPDHALGGIAQLRIADEAYTAGKSADAMAAYEKAVSALKSGPLAARAQLGCALAKAQAGKTAEATNDLKQLANDTNQLKAIRAEAAYHLTSLAVEASNATDAQKYSEQLMQIDPTSPWTQRAIAIRATLPAAPANATAPATKGAEKKDAKETAEPKVQVKVPGK